MKTENSFWWETLITGWFKWCPTESARVPMGVVEDEQVLVLIFSKRKHQCVQNETEVRNQLRTRFLLQSRERTEKHYTVVL